MTSKISFSKMVKDELKKLNWLTAVQFLIFALLLPFRVLVIMADAVNSIRKWGIEIDLENQFLTLTGIDTPRNTLVILGAGILCALVAFGYLHSAAKLDFWHSLPVKREQLFAVKYLASTITFVVVYVSCQVLVTVIGACYGVLSGELLWEMVIATVLGILYFLCSYAGTLLAIMLTGKFLTSVLAIGTLAGYLPLLLMLYTGLQTLFMETMFGNGSSAATSILRYTSPWAFSLFWFESGEWAKVGLTGAIPQMADLCQLIAYAAILSFVSLMLYRVRRTEAAGSALAFARTEGIVKLMLAIPAAVLAAALANKFMESLIWEAAFLVLFGSLACMIMEFIYRWDIRQVLGRKWQIIVTILAATVIFFPVRLDVLGINSYLPEKDEIQSMSIKDNYFWMRYKLEGIPENVWQTEPTTELMDYLETDKIDSIYEVAQSGVSNVGISTYSEDVSYVYLKYHLKNGKEIYRCYRVDTELYLECMDELLEDEKYRERYLPILNVDGNSDYYGAEAEVPVYLLEQYQEPEFGGDAEHAEEPGDADAVHEGANPKSTQLEEADLEYTQESAWIEIPASRLEELLTAYQTDLKKAKYSKIYYREATLWLDRKNYMRDMYPLDESFTETLEILSELYTEQ